jgi:preprotein translocase subunit YajC
MPASVVALTSRIPPSLLLLLLLLLLMMMMMMMMLNTDWRTHKQKAAGLTQFLLKSTQILRIACAAAISPVSVSLKSIPPSIKTYLQKQISLILKKYTLQKDMTPKTTTSRPNPHNSFSPSHSATRPQRPTHSHKKKQTYVYRNQSQMLQERSHLFTDPLTTQPRTPKLPSSHIKLQG